MSIRGRKTMRTTTVSHRIWFIFALLLCCIGLSAGTTYAQAKKPNIVVIWGDDIGRSNLSVFTKGMMGYQTPNIDRTANEGMLFTDYYAEQSCTAGRSAFITGQAVFRTGLSKVGMPASTQGLSSKDPTIAELLKNHGYATGQFGKNHLGDRNEFLPTVRCTSWSRTRTGPWRASSGSSGACASPIFTTCARTPTNTPPSPRTPTGTGGSITRGSSIRCQTLSVSSWQRSRRSRRG